jgi:cell wall-associated NlpC family hydrolase
MTSRRSAPKMDPAERAQRERLIAVARTWLATPFHDCAAIKGAGVDCGMFIKASFEEAGLITDVDLGDYSPQWYLHRNDELYLSAIGNRMIEINEADAIAGDIVLYKFGRCFSHGGIIIVPGWPKIIHAYRQIGCVTISDGSQGVLAQNERGVPRERKFFRLASWTPPRSG